MMWILTWGGKAMEAYIAAPSAMAAHSACAKAAMFMEMVYGPGAACVLSYSI